MHDNSEREQEKIVLFQFLDDADKILGKRLFFAQAIAPTRLAEMPDEIDDLDDIVHDLIPHLAIQIDFLNNNRDPTQQKLLFSLRNKRKSNTYAFDPDNLYKDARYSAQVGYARRQAGRFAEHGDSHLEHPQLCICPYGLELCPSRGWDVEVTWRPGRRH